MSLRRIVKFQPGHNCMDYHCVQHDKACYPGSGGSHGVHGMAIHFFVNGDIGAIDFSFNLCDMVPGRGSEMGFTHPVERTYESIRGQSLNIHSPKPLWNGHEASADECHWVGEGNACYCDGSTTIAGHILMDLAEHGDEAVWIYLENYYHMTFTGGPVALRPESKLVSR